MGRAKWTSPSTGPISPHLPNHECVSHVCDLSRDMLGEPAPHWAHLTFQCGILEAFTFRSLSLRPPLLSPPFPCPPTINRGHVPTQSGDMTGLLEAGISIPSLQCKNCYKFLFLTKSFNKVSPPHLEGVRCESQSSWPYRQLGSRRDCCPESGLWPRVSSSSRLRMSWTTVYRLTKTKVASTWNLAHSQNVFFLIDEGT